MIKTVNSKNLKTSPDLICSYCGRDHNKRDTHGNLVSQEGKDYVFERKNDEEYCICVDCQKECNQKGLN